MIKLPLLTQRSAALACSVVVIAALAGCGSDYKASEPYVPPPPMVSPSMQFVGDVGSTVNTPNADTLEPAPVDPAPAPTSETEEPVPVT